MVFVGTIKICLEFCHIYRDVDGNFYIKDKNNFKLANWIDKSEIVLPKLYNKLHNTLKYVGRIKILDQFDGVYVDTQGFYYIKRENKFIKAIWVTNKDIIQPKLKWL